MELRFDESDLAKEKASYFLQLEHSVSVPAPEVLRVEWLSQKDFVIHLTGKRDVRGSGGFSAQFMRYGTRGPTGGWLVG